MTVGSFKNCGKKQKKSESCLLLFLRLLHNEFLFFRTMKGVAKLKTVDTMLCDLFSSFCRMIEFNLEIEKKLQCSLKLCILLQTALWYVNSRFWKHSLLKFLQATNCYSQAATWFVSANREYDARIALHCSWLLQGQVLHESGYIEHDKTYRRKNLVA